MKGSVEKFKQWVKDLVNDKLQELTNNLFMPSSPLFTPSSPLELRFQALVEQIDKCKTNTLEVQKVVTAKNSEIEEMQKLLKLEIQINQKQISESFKLGIQDLNTKVCTRAGQTECPASPLDTAEGQEVPFHRRENPPQPLYRA